MQALLKFDKSIRMMLLKVEEIRQQQMRYLCNIIRMIRHLLEDRITNDDFEFEYVIIQLDLVD
jgi:hypothetical protein